MWYVGGECFDFCGCFDEVDVVVQLLYDCVCDEDVVFECVLYVVVDLLGDCCDEVVF